MSVQDLYFSTFARICGAMAGFSEPVTAAAFARLGRTLSLMDLRLSGTQDLTVDRRVSGLPILKEAVSVMIDLRNGVPGGEDPAALRQAMLDYMMERRRVPEPSLFARMSRAEYAAALAGLADPPFRTEPDDVALARASSDRRFPAAWDFWDGVSNTPIHVRCEFDARPTLGTEWNEPRLVEAARLFSGAQYKAATLAAEIDQRIPELRLKAMGRHLIGPFRSPVFTDVREGLGAFVSQVEDDEESWTLSWTVERLASAGTGHTGGKWFSTPIPFEKFAINTLDLECASRGVSDVEHHTITTHPVYQTLSDSVEGRRLLEGRRIHIVSRDGHLTEDV